MDLYARPKLPLLPKGAPRAEDIVARWRERAELALDDLREDPDGDDASYDALALRGAARRFDPRFAAELEALRESLDARISEDAEAHIRRALEVPDPQGWREACEDACSDEADLSPAADRLTRRLRLLLDLDDAELVAWSARDLGHPDEALELDLADCAALLATHRADFVDLAPALRAIGEALRPDLPELDPELALSAEKLVLLLDEVERAHAVLSHRDVAPLTGAELRGLRPPGAARLRQIALGPLRSGGLSLAASPALEASRRLEIGFEVPEMGCELVLIALDDGALGYEVYDPEGIPSPELEGCHLTGPGGARLATLRGSEGRFAAAPEVEALELRRSDGELLELIPRSAP